jgi:hypothetical protein
LKALEQDSRKIIALKSSGKIGFSVILNEVKTLNLLKIQDSSLRSE